MKRTVLTLSLILSFWINVHAQEAVEILRKADLKVKSFQSIGYKTKIIQKNPFSDGDTTRTNGQETIVYSTKGEPLLQNILNNVNDHQSDLREAFVNDSLYRIDLKDSTYSTDNYPKPVRSELAAFMWRIETLLKHNANSIIRHKDTVINNTVCYNFFVSSYDKMEDGLHNFTFDYYCLDKVTLMPVLYRSTGAGITKKGDYIIGRLHFYDETLFYNYQFNKQYNPNLFIFDKKGFDKENRRMLNLGITAPQLNLRSLSGTLVPVSDLNGKVLLIEFGSTTCGANPLANPMLNRLNQKYTASGVAILGIYADDTADQIKKYIDANHLLFPVYMSDKKLKHKFKTLGTPNLYVIDKQGRIAAAFDGYSDELEAQVINAIDKAL